MDFSSLPNAALWKRLFAIIYDILIFMAVAMAYGAAVTAIQVALYGKPEGRADMGIFGFIGLVILITGMCSFFWRHRGGQTLGMKAWRLCLISNDGTALSWGQCLARCLLGPAMLGLAGVGYFYSLIDKDSRCAHDILTGSRMVQLPKSK